MLVDMHHKLSEIEARMVMVAQEGMVAYKATKKCHIDHMQYATVTYLVGKNEIRSKVVICFPALDLIFLNVELEEVNDEFAIGPKDAVGRSGDAVPPPLVARDSLFLFAFF